MQYFMKIASQQILEAVVVGTNPVDGIPLVELTTSIDDELCNIGAMLVAQGFADFTDSRPTSLCE